MNLIKILSEFKFHLPKYVFKMFKEKFGQVPLKTLTKYSYMTR